MEGDLNLVLSNIGAEIWYAALQPQQPQPQSVYLKRKTTSIFSSYQVNQVNQVI
jgi:hypothetical protein